MYFCCDSIAFTINNDERENQQACAALVQRLRGGRTTSGGSGRVKGQREFRKEWGLSDRGSEREEGGEGPASAGEGEGEECMEGEKNSAGKERRRTKSSGGKVYRTPAV